MKLFILRIAILFLIIRNVKMADLSFYHTTDEIALKLDKLISSNKCQNFSIEKHGSNEYKLENTTIPLFFYDIKPKKPAEYQKKIFIIGGQHARELISTEFLFHFVQTLCLPIAEKNQYLFNFSFRIIVNHNPIGRQIVEKGDYCNRLNGNKVDLNRNYDIAFGKFVESPNEENPGNEPASEVETKFAIEIIKEFRPEMVIDIHSGSKALFYPWGYKNKKFRYYKPIKAFYKEVQKKYCKECQIGLPVEVLGYKASGSLMDYSQKKLGVKYALSWEIFEDPKAELSEAINENTFRFKVLVKTKVSKIQKFKDKIRKNQFSADKSFTKDENEICFKMFNPSTKEEYDNTIEKWIKMLNLFLKKYISLFK